MGYRSVAELPNDRDKKLLAECAQMYQPAPEGETYDLLVSPLGRFGYTNSRLYRVRFDRRRRPYVVKTDNPDVMRREGAATKDVRDIPGAEAAHLFPPSGDCQAIIFPLVSHGEEIKDLSELLFVPPSKPKPENARTSSALLMDLYSKLEDAHSTQTRAVSFGQEYERYLHIGEEPGPYDALGEYFESSDATAEINGEEVRNPGRILDDVRKLERDAACCLVHGDLHPRNVLIDGEQRTHLIDFAWGNRDAHWLKDFVLMETSIRFVEPPHGVVNQRMLLLADEALDESEDGPQRVRALAQDARADTATRWVLTEMADTVEVVRRHARSRNPDYDWEEYLIAVYLILMGGLRLKPYQHPRVLLSVCRIADALEARRFSGATPPK